MKIPLYLLLSFSILVSACSSSSDNSASPAASDMGTSAPTGGTDGPVPGPADPGEPVTTPSPDAVDGATPDSSGTLSDGAPAAESLDGDTSTSLSPDVPTSPQPESPRPIQPGTLTAGDYDDQLNPSLYQRYSENHLQNVRPQENIPRLNLSERVAIVIKGSGNSPYAGARVSLLDTQGNPVTNLVTPASGITYLYEDLDGLSDEFTLQISDRLGDISTMQSIALSSIGSQRQLDFILDTPSVANTQLDLQLVIDTTGSMGDELSYLQSELTSILNNIQNDNPQVSIRTGLIVYRDVGDQYVVRSYPFTDNLADMQSALNGETFDGGGDYPEAMDQALAEALNFDWREQSAKVSLLVADAPPHANRVNPTWASALAARSRQIHIVPLAASGVAEDAEYLMRSMAALTNSRYLFLTDDSGVGNPHNEPAVDCYIVTRLDGLIKRVINHLITGQRTEPSDNEVIREVGDYDDGVCRPDQQ